jgi:hypothetical protein
VDYTADSSQQIHGDLCALAMPVSKGMPTQLETSIASPVAAAIGHMNTAALKKFNEIKELLDKADLLDLMARHPICVQCLEVRDSGQYGTRTMENLAAVAGRDASTIRAYAKVAEFWPDEQQFRNAVTGDGKSLSLSHVVELTREKDADRRQRLASQALQENWSVRQLKMARRASAVKEADSSSPASEPLFDLTSTVEGTLEQLAEVQSTWEKDLSRQIEKVEAEELPAARDKLLQTRRQFETRCQAIVAALDEQIKAIDDQIKQDARWPIPQPG